MTRKYLKIIVLNDLKSYFSDSRSLSLFLFTVLLLFPLLIVGMFNLENVQKRGSDKVIVVGVSNESHLASIFKDNSKIEVKNIKRNELKNFDKEDVDIAVEEIGGKHTIYFYSSSVSSQYALSILQSFFSNSNIQNLENHNLSVFNSEITDISKDNETNFLRSMLSYLLIFGIFFGTTTIGVNIITGEKERKTINYLLATGIDKKIIGLSKLLSIAIVGIFSLLCSSLGLIFTSFILKVMDKDYIPLSLNATMLALLFSQLLIGTIMVSLLISIIAITAKTMKEANSVITPLNLLIIISGMLTTVSESGLYKDKFLNRIPLMNSIIAINSIVLNKYDLMDMFYAMGINFIVSGALVIIYIKRFNSEKYLLAS